MPTYLNLEALLETIPNPHDDADYVVRFTCPEFTIVHGDCGPSDVTADRALPGEKT